MLNKNVKWIEICVVSSFPRRGIVELRVSAEKVDFCQTVNILHCHLCFVLCDPWKRQEEMPRLKIPFSVRISTAFCFVLTDRISRVLRSKDIQIISLDSGVLQFRSEIRDRLRAGKRCWTQTRLDTHLDVILFMDDLGQ